MKYKMLPMTAAEIKYDAHRYALAHSFLADLRKAYSRGRITFDDFMRLRERALSGDKRGAEIELSKIVEV